MHSSFFTLTRYLFYNSLALASENNFTAYRKRKISFVALNTVNINNTFINRYLAWTQSIQIPPCRQSRILCRRSHNYCRPRCSARKPRQQYPGYGLYCHIRCRKHITDTYGCSHSAVKHLIYLPFNNLNYEQQ